MHPAQNNQKSDACLVNTSYDKVKALNEKIKDLGDKKKATEFFKFIKHSEYR